MKAIVYTKYGTPDVLQLREVEKPVPKDSEVLIKIYATTVTAVDCTFRRGEPLVGRLFSGLTKPRRATPGTEFSGVIEAVGSEVKQFEIGDEVFGTTNGYGAYAEYICLPEEGSTLSIKPVNLSYEEAAACDGGLTALPFLRDTGKLASCQEVLIYGASGSVGTAAVQLAKHLGAHVTGVCSPANLALVKSLGADEVIDYTSEDLTARSRTYDIIFDAVGKTSFSQCKSSLKKKGVFLEAALTSTILQQILWSSVFGNKKAKMAFTGLRPAKERTRDLIFLKELFEAGYIVPVIDRRYPLERMAEAHQYVDTGRKKGNVIINVISSGHIEDRD